MMTPEQIDKYEEEAASKEHSLEGGRIGELCSEVRRLRHELDDPNYQYVGRIHRQAILCRNGTIDRLRKEIAELKALAGRIPEPGP